MISERVIAKAKALEGSKVLGDDITLPYIWCSLHLSHNTEAVLRKHPNGGCDASLVGKSDEYLLSLLECIDSKTWSALCVSSGMTVYGAVALSWCKDAEIKDVWDGWEASGFPLRPLPEFERPARFVNPALMPKTRSLQGIVDEMGNSSIAICAAIASSPEPLEFDLDPNMIKSAKAQLASFLKSRMLQKQDRTAEEEALLKVWSEAVKDTEYDIWEGS